MSSDVVDVMERNDRLMMLLCTCIYRYTDMSVYLFGSKVISFCIRKLYKVFDEFD